MASTNTVKVEKWTLNAGTAKAVVVEKVATRNHLGQFHGSTNFKGSVLSK